MYRNNRIQRILLSALLSAAGVLSCASLQGCVQENGLCPEDQPGFENGREMWFSLDFGMAPGEQQAFGSTRADSDIADNENHPEDPAYNDENFIDPKGEMALLLFDNNRRLLKVFEKGDYLVTPSGGNSKILYSLVAKVNTAYFGYAGDGDADFYLMLAANADPKSDAVPGETRGVDSFSIYDFGSTPETLSHKLYGFPWSGNLTSTSNQVTYPWMPNAATGYGIPMSGMAKMTVTAEQLKPGNGSSKDSPFNLGTIHMQRNLAKIRIVDLLKSDFEHSAQITAVEISGFPTRGAFLPAMSATDNWGNPATTIIHNPATHQSWFNPSASAELEKGTGDYEGKEHSFFIGYTTECAVSAQTMPNIKITWTSDDKAGSLHTNTYTWAELMQTAPDATIPIVRNHVYEIVCRRPDFGDLRLELKVKDWNEGNTDNLEFTDIPGVEDVEWNGSRNDEKNAVVNLSKHVGQPDFVSMRMKTPEGCRWTAYLQTVMGQQGSIIFCDDKGNPCSTNPTGFIDGKETTLYFCPKDPTVTEKQSAELIIMVETQDGKIVEMRLTDSSQPERFTLVVS